MKDVGQRNAASNVVRCMSLCRTLYAKTDSVYGMALSSRLGREVLAHEDDLRVLVDVLRKVCPTEPGVIRAGLTGVEVHPPEPSPQRFALASSNKGRADAAPTVSGQHE